MATFLPKGSLPPSLGESLGEALGTGLGQGLGALAQSKLNALQKAQQVQQASGLFGGAFTPEQLKGVDLQNPQVLSALLKSAESRQAREKSARALEALGISPELADLPPELRKAISERGIERIPEGGFRLGKSPEQLAREQQLELQREQLDLSKYKQQVSENKPFTDYLSKMEPEAERAYNLANDIEKLLSTGQVTSSSLIPGYEKATPFQNNETQQFIARTAELVDALTTAAKGQPTGFKLKFKQLEKPTIYQSRETQEALIKKIKKEFARLLLASRLKDQIISANKDRQPPNLQNLVRREMDVIEKSGEPLDEVLNAFQNRNLGEADTEEALAIDQAQEQQQPLTIPFGAVAGTLQRPQGTTAGGLAGAIAGAPEGQQIQLERPQLAEKLESPVEGTTSKAVSEDVARQAGELSDQVNEKYRDTPEGSPPINWVFRFIPGAAAEMLLTAFTGTANLMGAATAFSNWFVGGEKQKYNIENPFTKEKIDIPNIYAQALEDIPTSGKAIEGFHSLTKDIFRPKDALDKGAREYLNMVAALAGPSALVGKTAKGLGTIFTPEKAKKAAEFFLPFSGSKIPLTKALKIAGAGFGAGKVAEFAGATPTQKAAAQFTAMALASLYGTRDKIVDTMKGNYKAASDAVGPEGKILVPGQNAVPAEPYRKLVEQMLQEIETFPSTAQDEIRALLERFYKAFKFASTGKGGRLIPKEIDYVHIANVIRFKQAINDWIRANRAPRFEGEPIISDIAASWLERLHGSIKDPIEFLAYRNPDFGVPWRMAEDVAKGLADMDKATRWLHYNGHVSNILKNDLSKYVFYQHLFTDPISTLGITGGAAATASGLRLVANAVNLFRKSPVARSEYVKAFNAMSRNNSQAAISSMKKFDKEADKFELDKKSKNNQQRINKLLSDLDKRIKRRK